MNEQLLQPTAKPARTVVPIVPASGSAHGYVPGQPDELLTRIGPGQPCGELLRRYWQPVAASAAVTRRPQLIKVLGEELVLFRTGNGQVGLLYPRCMHRGASLYYGKVGADSIACCYHGWRFDTEGHCLGQPCEPDNGRFRDKVRQPWYPTEERYGLVFAYLGPLDKKPVLPRYDILEDLAPGEFHETSVGGWGATRDETFAATPHVPYSWLQMNDNIMDPFHVQVLHSTFSVVQFAEEFAVMPSVEFTRTPNGSQAVAKRVLDDTEFSRITSYFFPNVMSIPGTDVSDGRANRISWVVPVDDTHYVQVLVARTATAGVFGTMRWKGKAWGEMTREELQDSPNDYEAQASAGVLSLHSEEHLGTSDRGIVMMRRMLKEQIAVVAEGGDPLGTSFDPGQPVISVPAGHFFRPLDKA
ncbi:Rieske 2Fe-2S domain-containing protein [Ideonella azotifigens]|uniref:Aromatic ring-hydroxylating dioxygenase subunit alpha n=1 Tax=Ideonella azotifigens TaxID=513160 RepID=A0ABN1JUR2_9BURK|nr:Rieske 2Fe-2S domain-containing protein [Ideonella azotifigens]MCD2341171.1 Rieske 2Fe-2S domain-containing protein [Ideonella azotifigens]